MMNPTAPQRLTRREFTALAGTMLLTACAGDQSVTAPLARLGDGSLVNSALDDRLTGTAQLIEKPAGSGKWRLEKE